MNISPFFYDFIHDSENLIERFGTEEGDAGLFEVREAFEDRRCRKMTTGMDDALAFVVSAPGNGSQYMFLENRHFLFHRYRRG